jgi:hypothetical protein
LKLTDVSEESAASTIRAMSLIALMMEAVATRRYIRKTLNFILAAVRT